MKNFNTNTTNDETWLTPPEILKALGHFDLDPCCPPDMPWQTATTMISLPTDGLSSPWYGRVWLNPPYGRETFKWVKKLSAHKEGGIALIFARTETKGFHEEIWEKAHSVTFFKGRLKFLRGDGSKAGSANAPSCLVSFTEIDTSIIANAIATKKIDAHLIWNNTKQTK